MSRAVRIVLAVLLAGVIVSTTSEPALACTNGVTLDAVEAECERNGSSSNSHVTDGGHTYEYRPYCALGGAVLCHREQVCTRDGHRGVLKELWIDGEYAVTICVTDQASVPTPEVTPDRVLRAMQQLDWPSSELIVQPPDGKTLVNFDTNFYTDNVEPTTQEVRLLGQRVTIEATPNEYIWNFGDDTSDATTGPGAAYPALEVTHNYLQVGAYSPSVDTTYTGRFRVNGGPWRPVPGSVTIDGEPVGLRAIEARPTLVGYDG